MLWQRFTAELGNWVSSIRRFFRMTRPGAFTWSPYLRRVLDDTRAHRIRDEGIVIAWDAGESKRYLINSFLCTDDKSLVNWARHQSKIQELSEGREVKYSKLNDGPRMRALPFVLGAASNLAGALVIVAVDKAAMREETRKNKEMLREVMGTFEHDWKPGALWHATIIVDMLNIIFTSYLPNNGRKLACFDEDDAIWGNSKQRVDFDRLLGNWYKWTRVRRPRETIGLTFDKYDPLGKNLTAIPDLVTGATADILDALGKSESTGSEKVQLIGSWIWHPAKAHKAVVVVVDHVLGRDGKPHKETYKLGDPFLAYRAGALP